MKVDPGTGSTREVKNCGVILENLIPGTAQVGIPLEHPIDARCMNDAGRQAGVWLLEIPPDFNQMLGPIARP